MSTTIPGLADVQCRLRLAISDICAPRIRFKEAHAVAFIARHWADAYHVELEHPVKAPPHTGSRVDFAVCSLKGGEALAGFEVKWGKRDRDAHYIVSDIYKLLCAVKEGELRCAYLIWGRPQGPSGGLLAEVVRLLDPPDRTLTLCELEKAATKKANWWTSVASLRWSKARPECLPTEFEFRITPMSVMDFRNGGESWELRCIAVRPGP